MINDKIIPKNSQHKKEYIIAIDLLASNIHLSPKDVAKQIDVHPKTVQRWLKKSEFVEAVYKRYMEVAGAEIPAVVEAMINEAKLGNVHAGRLVLEHFGKKADITVKVESNFEKFMKVEDDSADFFEINDTEEAVFEEISNEIGGDFIELPERDESNNEPTKKHKKQKAELAKAIKKSKGKEKEVSKQANRYLIRKRAKAVGLELLPPGRKTRSERDEWMKELERLENEQK